MNKLFDLSMSEILKCLMNFHKLQIKHHVLTRGQQFGLDHLDLDLAPADGHQFVEREPNGRAKKEVVEERCL